jgi:hypothetical protein
VEKFINNSCTAVETPALNLEAARIVEKKWLDSYL